MPPDMTRHDVSAGLLPGEARRRVSLLRHAERTGREQPARLSSTGRMRAFALPYLLRDVSRRDGWPLAPDRLIAAHDTVHSQRPSQTLRHLSHELSLPVHQARTAAGVLALLFGPEQPQTWRHAVIVWRHRSLLGIARALGAAAQDLPPDWPAQLYDRIVLMDFDGGGRVLRTRCVYADDYLTLAAAYATRAADRHAVDELL